MSRSTSDEKLKDIRDAIESGMSGQDIRELLHTSAGTITKIKRSMGIPIRPMRQTRTKGPIKALAQPSWDGRNYDIAEAYIESLDSEKPVPTAPLPPEAYVGAFENRVLEFHQLLKEKDTTLEHLEWLHEQELRAKDAKYEQLEMEHTKLLSEYQQTVFRQQNRQGPTSTMSQSLGNGG